MLPEPLQKMVRQRTRHSHRFEVARRVSRARLSARHRISDRCALLPSQLKGLQFRPLRPHSMEPGPAANEKAPPAASQSLEKHARAPRSDETRRRAEETPKWTTSQVVGVPRIQGYRFPAPGSRPAPNVPRACTGVLVGPQEGGKDTRAARFSRARKRPRGSTKSPRHTRCLGRVAVRELGRGLRHRLPGTRYASARSVLGTVCQRARNSALNFHQVAQTALGS